MSPAEGRQNGESMSPTQRRQDGEGDNGTVATQRLSPMSPKSPLPGGDLAADDPRAVDEDLGAWCSDDALEVTP